MAPELAGGVPTGGGASGACAGAGGGAGASAAAASAKVLGKRRRAGRTEVLVKHPGGGESQWQPIKSVSAAALAEYEVKRQRQQLQQSRMGGAAKPAKQPQAVEADGADPADERMPFRLLAQRRFETGQRYLVHWEGHSVTDASWESAKRINNPAMVADFEAAVKRARSHTEVQLRSGLFSLASLGFARARPYLGPSVRNADGTERLPAREHMALSTARSGANPPSSAGLSRNAPQRRKPTPGTAAPGGGAQYGAISGGGAELGGAGGGALLDDPTTSSRGLAPLGGLLKRRRLANAAAYAEDEPHVTDSALDSLFEALYAYITPTLS